MSAPAAPASSPSRAPRPWLLLVCVLIAVLATYSPTLGAPFVWDDYSLVVNSPEVKGNSSLLSHFGSSFWARDELASEGRNYYRPLTILSLVLDRRVHGDNPGGFHLSNVLLHLLNAGLLYALLRRRGVLATAAALGTALWALFPRLTEDVAWISGRTDSLAAAFVLLALHAAMTRGALARVATALAVLLGLLAKEVALAGAAAIIADALWGQPGILLGKRLKQTVPVLAGLAGYAFLRVRAVGSTFDNKLLLTVKERVLCALEAAGRYLWMCLDGWQPDPQMGFLVGPRAWHFVALGCVLSLGAALTALLFLPKHRRLVLPVTLGTTAALLTVHLIPISVDVIAADRFLYVPLLGLTLALVPAASAWFARRRLALAACGVLLLSYLFAASVRIADWSDEPRFWLKFYRQHPEQNTRPCIELGNVFHRARMIEEALRIYMSAGDSSDWNRLVARDNAALMLAEIGRRRAALGISREVNELAPDIPKFAYTLALLELQTFEFEAARSDLQRALKLFPGYREARLTNDSLARLIEHRPIFDAQPADKAAELALARANGEFGRPHDALRHFRRMIEQYQLTPAEWDECTWFALQFGEPETARWIFERYRSARGAGMNPRLRIAYDERLEAQAHLRAIFAEFSRERPL